MDELDISIKYFEPGDLDRNVIAYSSQLVAEKLDKGRVNLFLSGGSWINLYNKIFIKLLNSPNLSNLSIYQVDERYDVNDLHPNSNKKSILEKVSTINDMESRGVMMNYIMNRSSIEETVQNYEDKLKVLNDVNVINISFLGIGSDFHIAGIKPISSSIGVSDNESYTSLLKKKYFINYDANDFKNRLTMTFKSLKKMDYSVVYLKSQSKKDVVSRLRDLSSTHINTQKFPMDILKFIKTTFVFTDSLY